MWGSPRGRGVAWGIPGTGMEPVSHYHLKSVAPLWLFFFVVDRTVEWVSLSVLDRTTRTCSSQPLSRVSLQGNFYE